MGVYRYALRSPRLARSCNIRLKDGSVIRQVVASMSYAFKPHGWTIDNKDERDFNRYVAPSARTWEGIAQEDMPKYVAITDTKNGHKIKVGDPVYFWEKGALISCTDTPTYGNSVFVGTVEEIFTREQT